MLDKIELRSAKKREAVADCKEEPNYKKWKYIVGWLGKNWRFARTLHGRPSEAFQGDPLSSSIEEQKFSTED